MTTYAAVDAPKLLDTQELLLNMGPQHPSTHGVLHLVIRTDGEIVTAVDPRIGYLHRCAEKIAENLTYAQWVPYTDRMDYIAGTNNNLGICLAVEKLAGIEVPERAQWIRVILAELNRIASHLLAFGTFGLDIGAFTPFLYAFREREMILDILELYGGARLTTHNVRIGGMPRDLDKEVTDRIRQFLAWFEPKIREYNELLTYNNIFLRRSVNIGVIPPDRAIAYGLTGPCLRGSGVSFDIRKAEPYCVYPKVEFDVPVGTNGTGRVGDCWNRYYVRILEMEQSIRIVRQALEAIPAGKHIADMKRVLKPPKGEVYMRTESPRGELGFYIISEGGEQPLRLKVRSPAFSNLCILEEAGKDTMVSDLIAILGSLDIVLGEIDR